MAGSEPLADCQLLAWDVRKLPCAKLGTGLLIEGPDVGPERTDRLSTTGAHFGLLSLEGAAGRLVQDLTKRLRQLNLSL